MGPRFRWVCVYLLRGDRLDQARGIVLVVADPRVYRPAQPLPVMDRGRERIARARHPQAAGSGSLLRLMVWAGPRSTNGLA